MQKRDKNGRFLSNTRVAHGFAPSVSNDKKSKKKAPNLKNRVIFVLDESGSMAGLEYKLRQKYSELINELKENAKKHGQRTEVDLYSFSTEVREIFRGRNIEKCGPLMASDYRISNMTALFDAAGLAIENAQKSEDFQDENTSFLVIVLTDGLANVFTHFSARGGMSLKSLNELVVSVTKTGRWTVTFQVPRGQKNQLVNQLGLFDDCVLEWDQTEKGVEETFTHTSAGLTNYYNKRASGERAVKSFFVQPDLSNKTKEIKKLDDLSRDYTLLEVKKEEVIRPFVESKVGVYNIGEAFYLLQKSERVQSNKQVLLMDKFNKKIYGGREARDLIGLPYGAEAHVEPGNHGAYDIFVQSTSVNRKLPRGSKILVHK